MKLITIIIILIVYTNAFSQEQEKGLYFGLSAYPNISNGFASNDANDSEYYKGIKSTNFSYSAGIKVNYHFANEFGISTGLNYMKTGDRSLLYPPDPSRGLLFERRYKHKEHFLELPVNFYKKFSDKWLLTLGTSVMYNVVHRGLIFIADSDGSKLDAQTYENSKFGLTANLGFGYVLNLGNQHLEIQPYLQYNFIRPLNEYLYIDYTPARNFGSCGLQLNYIFQTSGK